MTIEIETSEQALTLALKLAIQAPTDEQHKLATDMAISIAHGMSPDTVRICKLAAQAAVEYEDTFNWHFMLDRHKVPIEYEDTFK